MIPKAAGASRPPDQRPITVLEPTAYGPEVVQEWSVQQEQPLGASAFRFWASTGTLNAVQLLGALMRRPGPASGKDAAAVMAPGRGSVKSVRVCFAKYSNCVILGML